MWPPRVQAGDAMRRLRQPRPLSLVSPLGGPCRRTASTNVSHCWPVPPAEIGDSLADVDTPALLLDLDAFDRNCAVLRASLEGTGLTARVHTKAHKSAALALSQLSQLGPTGRGVCCQTVTEAETMVQGGVRDVLLTAQVVGQRKIERLIALAAGAQREFVEDGVLPLRLSCLVDSAVNIHQLQAAAATADVELGCLVEVDVGQGRCGVPPGAPAAELAQLLVQHAPNLRFSGIHAYHGLAQHIKALQERRDEILGSVKGGVVETLNALSNLGVSREDGQPMVVTGGGTGTYLHEIESGVYTEVQPGSFAFMDSQYLGASRLGHLVIHGLCLPLFC